jgi:predicted Zn finger-like uncharacterized protein
MFKVVPDQLRVSEGWVRCGQCDEVFDANANLQNGDGRTEPAQESSIATASAAGVASLPAPPRPESPAPIRQEEGHDQDHEQDHAETQILAHDALDGDAFLEKSPPELSRFSIAAARQDFDSEFAPAPGEDRDGDEPGMDKPSPAADQKGPSFLRSGRAARSRPWVRFALSVCALVLAVLLCLQIMVQERDRLAVAQPALQPVLASLCAKLSCTLSPLRQIESVVIDASAFTRIRADVYRLNFTFKNTAAVGVAAPAIELTLTDLQDQPIVRRVFAADEFQGKTAVIAAGGELVASFPLKVKPNAETGRISGYRLVAFYP